MNFSRIFAEELQEAISKVTKKYVGSEFRLRNLQVNKTIHGCVLELRAAEHTPSPSLAVEPVNTTSLNSSHEGHDVVENSACGNIFKYCRNCKVEV